MDEHDITEQAYKNGYEQGKQDAVKWIPVTERLPEKCKTVLGYDLFNDVDEYGYTYPVKTVTHWMPLPHPPKGE